MGSIDLLSNFHDNAFVTKTSLELGLAENDTSARAAVRFMFACMKDEIPRNRETLTDYQEATVENTLEFIAFKTNLYYEFVDDFSTGHKKFDHDGAITALICDGHIERAELPDESPTPENFISSSGIDTPLIMSARRYINAANDIEDGGDPDKIPAEVSLILHIHMFKKIHDYEHELHDADPGDMDEMEDILTNLDRDLNNFLPYLRYQTKIGEKLAEMSKQLREELCTIIDPLAYQGQAANNNDKKPVLRPV